MADKQVVEKIIGSEIRKKKQGQGMCGHVQGLPEKNENQNTQQSNWGIRNKLSMEGVNK